MSWDTRYFQFGVLRIDNDKVKVNRDQSSYIAISVGKKIIQAAWAGQEYNITMIDGKVRRYRDTSSYTTIV